MVMTLNASHTAIRLLIWISDANLKRGSMDARPSPVTSAAFIIIHSLNLRTNNWKPKLIAAADYGTQCVHAKRYYYIMAYIMAAGWHWFEKVFPGNSYFW